MTTFLLSVLLISLLAFIHELGHFVAAKRAGIRVQEFGFGYPPRLLTIAKRGDTEYTINAIPFGAFVRMLGEEDPTHPDSFVNKGMGTRAITLAAGPILNVLLAFVLLFGVAFLTPSYALMATTRVIKVVPDSPAAKAGIRKGDLIVAINDEVVENRYLELRRLLQLNVGREVRILVEGYGGLRRTIELIPREKPPQGEGPIGVFLETLRGIKVTGVAPGSAAAQAGIRPGDIILDMGGEQIADERELAEYIASRKGWRIGVRLGREGRLLDPITLQVPDDLTGQETLGLSFRLSPLDAVSKACAQMLLVMVSIPITLAGLIRGTVSSDSVLGPIGIVQTMGEMAKTGPTTLALFTAALSLGLAIINLFPFPGLDGGRLLFVILEALRGGRKVDPRKEALIHLIGMTILIGLMFVISYFDILRILK